MASWYFLSDSSVSNTGKPFYLPENVGEVSVSLSSAIKLSRLGKFIEPKFASRYYQEAAPAIHFSLPQLESKLFEEGLSTDPSKNFDKSLFMGEFSLFSEEETLELIINGERVVEFNIRNLHHSVDVVIHKVSVMNTWKMGDILLPGLSGNVYVKEGDLLDIRKNGKTAFQIRVK